MGKYCLYYFEPKDVKQNGYLLKEVYDTLELCKTHIEQDGQLSYRIEYIENNTSRIVEEQNG